MDREEVYRGLMDRVRAFAEAHGGRLELVEPATDEAIDALADRIEPEVGEFTYPVPPSYRAFLKLWGGAAVSGGDFTGDEFRILTLDQVVGDTEELVHMPEGVIWEDDEGREVEISTTHLVAFAAADIEARWCFGTDTPGEEGELPVFYHQQDEPLCARDVETGQPIDPEGAEPTYRDFTEWLHDYVEGFVTLAP